jgi:transposase
MQEITRVAIDTSKSVLTLHGVDGEGRVVLRQNLRRQDLVGFFAKLAPVDIAWRPAVGRITGGARCERWAIGFG